MIAQCLALLCVLISLSPLQAREAKDQPTTQAIPIDLVGVSEVMKETVLDVIDEQLSLSGDKTASAALADDLAFFVRRHYLAEGYENVAVDWAMKLPGIAITVNEGALLVVGDVSFANNPGLEAEELKRYLLRPTRERIGRSMKDTPYVAKEVEQGLDLVLRYLLSQGYADASTEPPVVAITAGKANLSVQLHPAEQWHIGEIAVEGAPDRLAKAMRLEAELLHDQVANEARIERTRRGLEGLMQSAGYHVAKVSLEQTRSTEQRVSLRFTAQPGVLHRVHELVVSEEFSRGGQRLVRAIFKPTVGHVFDAVRMEQAYGKVADTGLFEHLEMEPVLTPGVEGSLGLAFSGEEAKASSVGVQLGYDTFLGAIGGLEYKNVNFWDSGGTLRAQLLATQLGFSAAVQWKNPAIFSSPYAFMAALEPETFTFFGYQRYSGTLRFGLSRSLGTRLSLEASLMTSINSVSSDTLTTAQLGPADYALAEGGLALVYEGRDNPVSPKRGWFASTALKSGYVGGDEQGDVAYERLEVTAAWYKPLTAKWRTSLGLRMASLISGSEVDDIPIELRNYNGGANGVRSFLQRQLGPRAEADETPLGGTQSQTLSGEVGYEIINNLELAGFVDVGSLSTSQGNWLPQFNDMRYAAGLGLRYKLPFGPLRVDYGVNLNRRTGEAFGALHIGFGMAF